MNEVNEAVAAAKQTLEDGGRPLSSEAETHLDKLLHGLPDETKAELLDVIRKEKIFDENDVVIQTARVFSIFTILQRGIATEVKESVIQTLQLSEKSIQQSDIGRIEKVAEELKICSDEISRKYGKARGATYAIHSLALTFAVLQGILLGYLMAENLKVGLILVAVFLLGLFISTFLQRSWQLIKIWFMKKETQPNDA